MGFDPINPWDLILSTHGIWSYQPMGFDPINPWDLILSTHGIWSHPPTSSNLKVAIIQENYNTPRYRTPQAIPCSPIMKGIPAYSLLVKVKGCAPKVCWNNLRYKTSLGSLLSHNNNKGLAWTGQEKCLARKEKMKGTFFIWDIILYTYTCIECLGKYRLLQFISFLSKPTKDRLSDWEASNSLDRNDLYTRIALKKMCPGS